MPKESASSKGINITDTVFVVGLMVWSCYLIGRCRFEGFAEGIGIPRRMIGLSKESYVELGASEVMLYVFIIPGVYFMLKGILSSLGQVAGTRLAKLKSFIQGWQEDTRLIVKSLLAFGIGWLILQFGTSYFIERGRVHGENYLKNPTIIRYVEKSAPTEKKEAVMLHRNAGRYFLKPRTMENDTSFIIIEESEFLKIEVLK